jgi:hypothetical protein
MEEFLLEFEGRLLRVMVEDSRGADGAVPTLVCRGASWVRMLPQQVPPPPDPPGEAKGPPIHYPGFPQMLAERVLADPESVREVRLDVSGLPSGLVPFAIDDFSAQAAKHATDPGGPIVELGSAEAAAWGCEMAEL